MQTRRKKSRKRHIFDFGTYTKKRNVIMMTIQYTCVYELVMGISIFHGYPDYSIQCYYSITNFYI